MKKFFTKIMKLFYKYDSRYTIVKNEEFKHDKTIVWSVDHSWNSVEWCLPGLYYLKEHYDVNLLFLAADPEIWQKLNEEGDKYAMLKDICDVIIINVIDPSKCNWLQRKIYRLRKSLLEEESLKYFFGNVKVDVLIEILNPRSVNNYFKKCHPNTIRIGYEHGTCDKLYTGYCVSKRKLPDVDYYFCGDIGIYDLSDDNEKNKIIEIGVPQLDSWWRELINENSILNIKRRLDANKKNILILMPAMLYNERLSVEDKENLIKCLKYFSKRENVLLKFHPRETQKTINDFLQNISDNTVIVTSVATECVSKFADCVVVAGVNSAAGAAIINDVPVIEFHSNNYMESFAWVNGKYGSLLKVKNAVMSAEDYNTLKDAIKGILYDNAWDAYRGKYKAYIFNDDKASERFAEELANLLQC